ncbi:MAG: hypothetical protein V4710_19840, partial [Verrucomicrobiota bacterium]
MIAFFSSFRRPHAIALAILVAGVTPLLMNGAESGISVGTVSDPAIKEASGLVASVDHPGVLWTHNDSNASLFALRTNGELIARFKIPGAAGGNFEDLAFAPGTQPGSGHLYLGDIGDNKRERDSIAVFRTPEPPLGANKKAGGKLSESKKIILRYPDGPYDAESLFIDPLSGDLFIATKEKRKARVYTASKAQLEGNAPVLLRFVCELRIASASGAAISADGTQIALRNEDSAQL